MSGAKKELGGSKSIRGIAFFGCILKFLLPKKNYVGATKNYGGPQLSQQQQITHSNNKLIATTTKTSHQNQMAHSTNKILTAQTKTLTAQTKTFTAQTKTLRAQTKRAHSTTKSRRLSCLFLTAQTKTFTAQTKTLTAQTKRLTAPPDRGGLSCLFLDLEKEGITWPWQVKIFAEVLDFLTRVCLENVWDSGQGENRVDSSFIQ